MMLVALVVAGCLGGGDGGFSSAELRVALRQASPVDVIPAGPPAGGPVRGRIEWLAGSGRRVVAHTRAGQTSLSVDGGRHWRRVRLPGAGYGKVAAVPGLMMWPGPDQCRLVASRDDGRTREELAGPNPGRCEAPVGAVAFADRRRGLGAITGGERDPIAIYATRDGGHSWRPRAPAARGRSGLQDVFSFAASARAALIVLSDLVGTTVVRVTRDGGRHWATVATPAGTTCSSAAALGDELWLLCGGRRTGTGIAHSSDGGRRWRYHATRQRGPVPSGQIVAVAPGRVLAIASDESRPKAAAVATASTLLSIEDGGAVWRQIRPALPLGPGPTAPPGERLRPTGVSIAEPPPGRIARSGEGAAVLIVQPPIVQPGAIVRLRLENVGSIPLTYGLSFRVQRRVGRRWRDASQAVFGTREPVWRRSAQTVAAGRRSPAARNPLLLPATLKPGLYRVVKDVGDQAPGRAPGLRLTDTVRVVSHGAPRPVPGALGRCAGYRSIRADVDGDGRSDVVTFDAQRPDDPFVAPRDYGPGSLLVGVCTATGGYDHIIVGGMGELLNIVDIEPDGRDEILPGGTTVSQGISDVLVFRAGRLRYVTSPHGRQSSGGYAGFGLVSGNTGAPADSQESEDWGCRDTDGDGVREIVKAFIRWDRHDDAALTRRAYRLRGTVARLLTHSTTRLGRVSRRRSAARYVKHCRSRSIYDR